MAKKGYILAKLGGRLMIISPQDSKNNVLSCLFVITDNGVDFVPMWTDWHVANSFKYVQYRNSSGKLLNAGVSVHWGEIHSSNEAMQIIKQIYEREKNEGRLTEYNLSEINKAKEYI